MNTPDSPAVVSLRRHAANIRRWTVGDSRIVADIDAVLAELDEARRPPRVWLEGDEVPADVWVQFPSGSITAVQAAHLVVQFPLVEVFVVADHAAAVAAARGRREAA